MKVSFLTQSPSEKVTLLLLARSMRELKSGITGSSAVLPGRNQAGCLGKLLSDRKVQVEVEGVHSNRPEAWRSIVEWVWLNQ
jgi:hypothetical protein